MSGLETSFLADLLTASLRMSIPILLAALGGMLSERSGVVNIGIEGMMLFGAFWSVIGAFYTKSVVMGLILGVVGGLVLNLFFGILTNKLHASQIVAGIAINIFSLGVTSYFFRIIFGITAVPQSVPTLKPVSIPLLSQIPFLGPTLFHQNMLVYAALLMVPVVHLILFHTSWGLRVRACGEYPRAVDSAGLSVFRYRMHTAMLCGIFASLGGVSLALGNLGIFGDNMTAGRGFIALAAVVFGKWTPVGVLAASLFFGLADAFQLRMQSALALPFQFFLMIPYVLTLIVLVGFGGKAVQPASNGTPYIKGER
ncbi:ABC transporter permease [Candidatus Formimonas warabiya]|uniref:Branched-chain amino acid ABC transporter permease n=1 Tax=Formimonas warabiya TaxID=1761012 RepID=A0A3G1KQ88_FORW1|nr:ABC transporter permease [Candidatus Formimonas warabiya]ATW24634.1 branched-chain amino acid ABC transporter permease [Candidatus Formimonas warabiya]